jgi:hypothetical protein
MVYEYVWLFNIRTDTKCRLYISSVFEVLVYWVSASVIVGVSITRLRCLTAEETNPQTTMGGVCSLSRCARTEQNGNWWIIDRTTRTEHPFFSRNCEQHGAYVLMQVLVRDYSRFCTLQGEKFYPLTSRSTGSSPVWWIVIYRLALTQTPINQPFSSWLADSMKCLSYFHSSTREIGLWYHYAQRRPRNLHAFYVSSAYNTNIAAVRTFEVEAEIAML